MPVSQLLVEGNLDAEVLDPIIGAGITVVNTRGSKNSLPPRVREDWKSGVRGSRYIRDRDFDFEPPADAASPTPDRQEAGEPLGWRWCRHSIENYLIDPSVVEAATGWARNEYCSVLSQSALSIRHYQVARWVVGTVRQGLPPHFKLATCPDDCASAEIGLPTDLSEQACLNWSREHLRNYFARVAAGFQPDEIARLEVKFSEKISVAALTQIETPLLWCSGKDLLAGMAASIQTRGHASPKAFINAVRDWIRENPEQALTLLPEWRALLSVLAAVP